MAKEKIMIGIDDQVIQLTGADLDAFIADREARQAEASLFEAEQTAKAEAKESAKTKLASLGLTEEEIAAFLN